MTRDKVKELYPDIASEYEKMANEFGLAEEMWGTFEEFTKDKENLNAVDVELELSEACYEWDF